MTTPTREEAETALDYATPHPKNDAAISLNAVKLREATNTIRARLAYLEAEVARKNEALTKIADNRFLSYENTENSSYGIGVTDGHRLAAQWAREGLSPQPEKEKPEC